MLIPPEIPQPRYEIHPGFRLVWPKPGEAGTMSIEYWSDELDAYLQKTDVADFVVSERFDNRGGGLGFLLPIAGRIRGLGGDERILEVLPQLRRLESLEFFGKVDGIDFQDYPELKRVMVVGGFGNLSAAPSVQDVTVVDLAAADLTGLAGLAALRRLTIKGARRLRSLKGVEGLPLEHVQVIGPTRLESLQELETLSRLESLDLDGVRKAADIQSIGTCSALRVLRICSGPELPSLDFVGKLTHLQELGIVETKIRPPVHLAPLAALSSLRILKLGSGIRSAVDPEVLGEMRALEVLGLDGGPELPSLEFLRNLSRLEEFWLISTPVRDGNLRPILELPNLKRVHALDPVRKHYSHSGAEIVRTVRARHPLPIPTEIEAARKRGGSELSRLYGEAGRLIKQRAGDTPVS